MTNHPIHRHGHEFLITGTGTDTDGGPTPKRARQAEITADIAIGQMRQIDFLADEPGDWAFHCHKSHHTMNAMGHNVPTMIGVDHRDVVRQITRLVPDYMVMGERGMHNMTEMQMPLPDNTAAMMAGQGPFGAVGMGGMLSVLKVRADQPRGDYADPGWYLRFTPDRIALRQGDTVRFTVRNRGRQLHEFVIGTQQALDEHAALMLKFPNMAHDEPYMAHVGPGKTGEIVWTFNRAGDFGFACLIAGHYQAGMVGRVTVAARPASASTTPSQKGKP